MNLWSFPFPMSGINTIPEVWPACWFLDYARYAEGTEKQSRLDISIQHWGLILGSLALVPSLRIVPLPPADRCTPNRLSHLNSADQAMTLSDRLVDAVTLAEGAPAPLFLAVTEVGPSRHPRPETAEPTFSSSLVWPTRRRALEYAAQSLLA